jgi:hypothetical protein
MGLCLLFLAEMLVFLYWKEGVMREIFSRLAY